MRDLLQLAGHGRREAETAAIDLVEAAVPGASLAIFCSVGRDLLLDVGPSWPEELHARYGKRPLSDETLAPTRALAHRHTAVDATEERVLVAIPLVPSAAGRVLGVLVPNDAALDPVSIAEELATVFDTSNGPTMPLARAQQTPITSLFPEPSPGDRGRVEALSTLAGGIAHDFNNLLAAIVTHAELAGRDATPGSELAHSVQQILEVCGRAEELVRQILTIGRINSEARVELDLATLVTETVRLLRMSVSKSIEIEVSVAPRAGLVLGDPQHLEQVILNLCINAEEAIRQRGGGRVGIEVRPSIVPAELAQTLSIPPGRYVVLEVDDDGDGIPPEQLPRVFEPFYTTKPIGDGRGLGLSIVHGIVRSHGGAIRIESNVGVGTKVKVWLPRRDADGEVSEQVRISSVPARRGRVLIVDDEAPLARGLGRLLTRLGWHATVSTDPLEALTLFEQNPDRFDVVVTDQTMPLLSGDELVVALRAIRPSTPIVMCTGFSQDFTAEDAAKLGIDRYLTKPLSFDEFERAIAELTAHLASSDTVIEEEA